MTWEPVESSNISALAYEAGVLRVRFRNGTEYEYKGVKPDEVDQFRRSPSKGKWFNHWRANREGQKLDGFPTGSEPTPARPIHMTQCESVCCRKALDAASLASELDAAQSFNCPTCGSSFLPTAYGPLRRWDYQAAYAIV